MILLPSPDILFLILPILSYLLNFYRGKYSILISILIAHLTFFVSYYLLKVLDILFSETLFWPYFSFLIFYLIFIGNSEQFESQENKNIFCLIYTIVLSIIMYYFFALLIIGEWTSSS